MSPAFRLIALSLLASVASVAQANDSRLMYAEEAATWKAVGRLDVGTGQLCTATMIAPDLVVTSGWCVRDPLTGGYVLKNQLSFRAGMREGQAAAARRARAMIAATLPAGADPCAPETLASDVALIWFSSPIRAERAEPLPTGALREGETLTMVHYGGASANAPSIVEGCAIGSGTEIDCAAPRGAAGAPVVAGSGETRRVVAVVASNPACGEGGDVVVAPIAPHLEALRARLPVASP